MKRKSKGSVLLALMLVFSLFLTACSGGGGEKSSNETNEGGESGTSENTESGSKLAEKQVLHMAASSDIPSLDIHHATDALSFGVDYQIRSGLMTLNEKGKVVPDMAAKVETNEAKTVYTFTLREGVKWSDGSPVTAQDFVYSWRRDVDPKEAGEYAYIYGSANIKNAAKIMSEDSGIYGQVKKLGVQALDEKTLQVTLEKPTPYFLSLMTFPPFFPLKKEIVEKYGEDYATAPDKMVYNGAFVLESWNHGEGWMLKKNPKYWNAEQVKLDKVQVKVVKDAATRIRLYQTDQLAFASLTSQYVTQFKNKKGFHKGALTSVIYFLRVNHTEGSPLANENIRDAIYNAIDRKGLVKGLLRNGSAPAHYLVPKNFVKGPNGKDFRAAHTQINKHSLEWAKKKWKQGLEELGKEKLTLELLTTDGSSSVDQAVYLQAQLQEHLPGLTVKINKQPSGNYYDLRRTVQYDLCLSNWIPDYRDPMTYLGMWITNGGPNDSGYSNPEYDKLVEKAKQLGAEPEKRWKVMQQAEKVLLEDAGIIPLYQDADMYVLKPYVKHFLVRNYGPETDYTYSYILKH